ncbi:hypothetical protein FOA52_012940 [Chlamydomonas sp. UWO 241]|nr:hypothetical protein FOA52_012940 [Chlamydomonas sp. UWO 241]
MASSSLLRATVGLWRSAGGAGAPTGLLGVLGVGGARSLSASITATSEVEQAIAKKLAEGMKGAKTITVKDTSGGCGAFYTIEVTADEFKGHSIVKQHQLVHVILKEEMADWHGCNLATRVPPS